MTTVQLELDGMTCAACAARIEKSLNRLDGVEASVNFATEQASVRCERRRRRVDDLLARGRGRRLPRARSRARRAPTRPPRAATRRRGRALTVPLALIAMVPALGFDGWEWVAFALATPVWALGRLALPPRRAARALRHRAATMDTLDLARDDWRPTPGRWSRSLALDDADVYFEVASRVTTLILLGRWLEARARRRSGAALRSLLELGAKEARVLRGRRRGLGAARGPRGRRPASSSGRARSSPPTASSSRARSAIDQSMLTGEPVPVDVGPGAEVAGATVNASGRLVVRATRVGADTALAQIARLVAAAQAGKAPIQRLADRVSGVFVPIVIGALAGHARRLAAPRTATPPGPSRPPSPS